MQLPSSERYVNNLTTDDDFNIIATITTTTTTILNYYNYWNY